jgi:peptidyl-prolyl cis-trans isomerase B (cyclophilin B)
VMHANATHLDGQYTAFGKLITGQEVVEAIVATPRGRGDKPNIRQGITKVTVIYAN